MCSDGWASILSSWPVLVPWIKRWMWVGLSYLYFACRLRRDSLICPVPIGSRWFLCLQGIKRIYKATFLFHSQPAFPSVYHYFVLTAHRLTFPIIAYLPFAFFFLDPPLQLSGSPFFFHTATFGSIHSCH